MNAELDSPKNGQVHLSPETGRIRRRAVLAGAVAVLGSGAAVSVAATPAMAAHNKPTDTAKTSPARVTAARSETVIARSNYAVVETNSGKVAGYTRNGTFIFKGIPYGDTTEGKNRFLPPLKPKPWSGVRSSRQYGSVAPQGARNGWANDEEAFMFAWNDGVQGEDCLRINVWTPALHDNGRRPVMVWLHGGGFAAGSGQELLSYDGENLARRGDLVVVTLNHRLNVLGHLNLAKYGEKYATSSNAGMLDIVQALEWVRDNISSFGGDPNCVTIFGQSGGGGKVGVLMGMPAAKDLFHRAIVESGSMLKVGSLERSQQFADLIVAELGLSASTIDQMQSLPYTQLLKASEKVQQEHTPRASGGLPDFRHFADMLGFLPVVDGNVLPAQPFDPKASLLSADVPMIIGTTLNEFTTAMNHPEYELMTEAELEKRVHEVYGDKAARIIAVFRQRTPDAKNFDLWSRIASVPVRANAIDQARAKAALNAAPAYLYWFTWQTPILDGRPGAFHCAEIPFVFGNTDFCDTMTGGGADARALADRMSEAWIQFARTGNPDNPNIPHWSEFSPATIPTMIFDNTIELKNDPDGGERNSIVEA